MPTPTYVPLSTITLASTDSEIVFSSIPATYRDLIVVTDSLITNPNTTDSLGVRFNGDTSSNYSWVRMVGTGSTTASASGTTNLGYSGVIGPANKTPSVIQVMDYSATDKHKTIISRSGGGSAAWVTAFATRWANTSAVTSIAIRTDGSHSFTIGSTFSLYGVN